MQERRKDQGVQQVNAIAREVVEQHDRATYVDAYELFSDDDADGGYVASVPGPSGKSVRVRAGDGIHFTVEGGDLLGDFVYTQLEARCDLDDQAVPDQPKTVLRTRGSGGPGTSGGSSGGSGSSGGTAATTAPPVTSPPETAPAPAPEPEPDTTPTTESETPKPPDDLPEPPEPQGES
jgi:hypothetical protein